MNPEKVVFGFFIVLALTLNFGFFVGDIDNPDSNVSKKLESKKVVQIKKEFGTGPQVHYLLEEGVKL